VSAPDERALWRDEVRRARFATWALRGGTLAGVSAYLFVMIGLKRTDAFYIILNLFAVISGLSQLVFIERYRVPGFLERAARGDAVDLEAARAIWREIGPKCAFAITALTRARFTLDETRALSFEQAVEIVRAADRAPWPRIAQAWTGIYLGIAVAVVVATLNYVPEG